MTQGKLVIVKLPWMLSPSVSDLRVEVIENGDCVISAEVAVLPESAPLTNALDNRRVSLTFAGGQWVRTHPYLGDHVIPPNLFEPPQKPWFDRLSVQRSLRQCRELWVSSGHCPNSRVYQVQNSSWIREQNAERYGCQHFVLQGHDIWVELLAKSFRWRWSGASSAEVINTDELGKYF